MDVVTMLMLPLCFAPLALSPAAARIRAAADVVVREGRQPVYPRWRAVALVLVAVGEPALIVGVLTGITPLTAIGLFAMLMTLLWAFSAGFIVKTILAAHRQILRRVAWAEKLERDRVNAERAAAETPAAPRRRRRRRGARAYHGG